MTKNTIVILRGIEDSADYVRGVLARGYQVLVEPVFTIEYLAPPMDIKTGTPLIFTSSHGVAGFCVLSPSRDHPVYTVGENTADAATKAGFSNVISANGAVGDLAKILVQSLRSSLMTPIYVRGADISVDLAGICQENGVRLAELTVYSANRVQNLSKSLINALNNHEIFAVMTFSKRGAMVFCDLIGQNGMGKAFSGIKALCVSENVRQQISVLNFQESLVAQRPDRYGMMELLEHLPHKNLHKAKG